MHPDGGFITKAEAYNDARRDVLQEKCEIIDDEVRHRIFDEMVADSDYGYCGDCDRGCCDDCDAHSDGASEGYEDGYRDALEGKDNWNSNETYADEVIAMNLRREEEAHKAQNPKQD